MSKILSINRRHYPTQASFMPDRAAVEDWCADPPGIVTVLVEGDIGDYAAYSGIGEPEWVARHGDKIGFEEAAVHFLGIKRENYRER